MNLARIGTLLLGLIASALCLPAQEPQGQLKAGYRHHFRRATSGGRALTITLISRAGNLGPTTPEEPVMDRILLETAEREKWMATSESEGPSSGKTGSLRFDLLRLETGERVSLHVSWPQAGQPAQYALVAGGETLRFSAEEQEALRPRLRSRLQDHYSPEFLEGLALFRALAYGVRGLPLHRTLFEILYGEPQEGVETPRYDLERLPVDCAFDATFGFPCEEGETPKGAEAKILVLEGAKGK
jgi:hypothetical protein